MQAVSLCWVVVVWLVGVFVNFSILKKVIVDNEIVALLNLFSFE